MVNILIQRMLAALLGMVHPIYVAMIDINHNAGDTKIEISVRAFADDLEKTLQRSAHETINIRKPADKHLINQQLADYINRTIKIKINGQLVNMQLTGYEIQEETVWCYLLIPKIARVTKLDADCTLLYSPETTQSNIFHVKSNGQEKSARLAYPAHAITFDF